MNAKGPTQAEILDAHRVLVAIGTTVRETFMADLDTVRRTAQILADIALRMQP